MRRKFVKRLPHALWIPSRQGWKSSLSFHINVISRVKFIHFPLFFRSVSFFAALDFSSENFFLGFVTHVTHFQALNPSTPKSHQRQFSPYNMKTKSREKVIRIGKMIVKGGMLWYICYQILPTYSLGKCMETGWRICMWILGLEGLLRCGEVISISILSRILALLFLNTVLKKLPKFITLDNLLS